jgi:hypothetical protein
MNYELEAASIPGKKLDACVALWVASLARIFSYFLSVRCASRSSPGGLGFSAHATHGRFAFKAGGGLHMLLQALLL